MTTQAQRVAARYLIAKGLDLGRTWENNKVRIHRYSNSFHVWDLTNAGKRGKKVRFMTILPKGYRADEAEWLEQQARYLVLNAARGYDGIKRYFETLPKEKAATINERQERGIDVLPAGTRKINLKWADGTTNLRLEADPHTFMVVSSALIGANEKGHGGFRQDTGYHSEKKTGAKRFYGWLVNNETKVKKMGISDLRDIWRELKIPYRYH